jgi:anti-sigma regulatory factor (Ser/Thr protein kinase)
MNLAFADAEMQMLCPYDTSSLEACVLADAERAHPGLVQGERRRVSSHYVDPLEVWRAAERRLGDPEQPVMTLEITDDLANLRSGVSAWAGQVGLARLRTADLLLAVNEAATNSLLHGSPPVRLRAWVAAAHAVCEVSDGGQLTEPLAGRMRPSIDASSGRGVWLINQLCDLVELRPCKAGTTIRMRVRLGS